MTVKERRVSTRKRLTASPTAWRTPAPCLDTVSSRRASAVARSVRAARRRPSHMTPGTATPHTKMPRAIAIGEWTLSARMTCSIKT